MKHSIAKIAVLILSGLALAGWLKAAPPPTADDVGDLDSLGRNAKFMGAASGNIILQTDPCPSPTPGPSPSTNPANGDQCFQITDTSMSTEFDAQNSCRINLPRASTQDIIYPVLTFFYRYNMSNKTGNTDQARFEFMADITIVSEVLNDPSCVDPNTGKPCFGRLQHLFTRTRVFDDRRLDAGEHAEWRMSLTRAGNAGINKANLIASGLSPTLVDNLFRNPMTIQLNVFGTAKRVDFAQIITNMRLFGD